MELFAKLFDRLLVFVYHCFDRIVIHGYLSGLSRPEQVVYFFRQVLGTQVVDKEALRRRTNDYQAWVEAYARNHRIPFEWADKGVRKEDHVLPPLPDGEDQGFRCLFHLQEHGTGPHLPRHRAQVSHPGSQPPHSGAPAQPIPITTSTSAMRSWDRSSSASPASSPSTPPIGSTATPSPSGN
jgi:hypothetical protein